MGYSNLNQWRGEKGEPKLLASGGDEKCQVLFHIMGVAGCVLMAIAGQALARIVRKK